MHFIDSHAHINANEFKEGWKNVVASAKNAGLSAIINIGSDLPDSEWALKQGSEEPMLHSAIGVHPEHLAGSLPDMAGLRDNLRRLIGSGPRVVAIGELGLDYTLDLTMAPEGVQKELIVPQLELAHSNDLPVVLHVRDQKGSTRCFDDMLSIIQQFTTSSRASTVDAPTSDGSECPPPPDTARRGAGSQDPQARPGMARPPLRGVFHCWTGTPDQVSRALDLDFYISFSGIVTYKSAGHILEAAAMVPDDRLLIETDAPYLTPEPARSEKKSPINLPEYVILTAEKLANVRNATIGHIAEVTAQNAISLFALELPRK